MKTLASTKCAMRPIKTLSIYICKRDPFVRNPVVLPKTRSLQACDMLIKKVWILYIDAVTRINNVVIECDRGSCPTEKCDNYEEDKRWMEVGVPSWRDLEEGGPKWFGIRKNMWERWSEGGLEAAFAPPSCLWPAVQISNPAWLDQLILFLYPTGVFPL